jgi:serine/threonine-protein kinase
MRPLSFLKCVGKAALKQAAKAAGFGIPEIVEDVWNDWNKEQDAAQRQAELQAIVQMAADQFRQEVEAIVRDVAAGQPEAVRRHVSDCLQQVPDQLRRCFRRPDDPQGASVPPGLGVKQMVSELLSQLPIPPTQPPRATACPRVTLEFTRGQLQGQTRSFIEPTTLLLGRHKDCEPRFIREAHDRISRHHALVEINPPDVCVRDLGSLNGTFINGEKVGQRPPGTDPDKKHTSAEKDVPDGAEVVLAKEGGVAFRVRVFMPVRCTACGVGLADDRKAACAQPGGGYLCPGCRRRADDAAAPVVKPCAWCQREVRTERGANRPGLFVCGDCRNDVQGMMRDLLGQAQAGAAELRVLRGYDLLEELGTGGMGAVYLARHQRTAAPAAIKLMLPKVAADEEAIALFQREIRNTLALSHRHVVRLLDHGFARGAFFMVLEYCDGGSAEDLRVQRGGVLPVDEAVEIAAQALEGLAYCHTADIPFVKQKGGGYGPGKGVVHRDVKPANLFLTGWGSGRLVKVGDFGLAKAFAESGLSGGTRTGDVGGTYEFMCRQQVAYYKDAGPEVDVWSLAASLYYLLTGRPPRDFGDGDKCLAVLEVDPTPVGKLRTGLPPRLAEVIDAALREEPAMAFKTAGAFKRALEDAV